MADRGNPIGRFFRVLGPGLVSGVSDADPASIGTFAKAGAALGYATLWLPVVYWPLLAAVQYTCAKIGMVSGRGLAGALRERYSRWLVYPAVAGLVVANTVETGADIGGVAASLHLVVPLSEKALVAPIALLILGLLIWLRYRRLRSGFKWLTLSLFAYIAAGLLSRPAWGQVLRHTFVPTLRLDHQALVIFVGIAGASLSPYLFFWLTAQEVEEERAQGRQELEQRRGATDDELRDAALDVNAGVFAGNLAVYFVVLATAATLFRHGQHDVPSAAAAAQALAPIAGRAASLLFAAGMVGVGFLAVPVLTGSAAYAVAELFGWRHGLDEKASDAKAYYATIAVLTLAGMCLNFTRLNPVRALLWATVIDGVLCPPLLVLILLAANNRDIMGARVNPRWINALGWAAAAASAIAVIGLVCTWGRS